MFGKSCNSTLERSHFMDIGIYIFLCVHLLPTDKQSFFPMLACCNFPTQLNTFAFGPHLLH